MPTESELRHNPGLDPLPDVDALLAENAKLRAALERIASETAATWVSDVAKEALKRKARYVQP